MNNRLVLPLSALQAAAASLGCSLPAVQAVVEVESAGSGFLSDGSVRVLFEGHIFWKYTRGRWEEGYPTLCYPKWTTAHYARGTNADERGTKELVRLKRAMTLDRPAALMSASYGMFQIMGFNFPLCGYRNVDEFYAKMQQSAKHQLNAFCAYIEHTGLADELRDRRWADFARKYNGPAYQKNRYDEKLAVAYTKHAKGGISG